MTKEERKQLRNAAMMVDAAQDVIDLSNGMTVTVPLKRALARLEKTLVRVGAREWLAPSKTK